jgi:hypothetical protein
MNIEDKFFDKIKQAAQEDSIENFEGMDKVWQKIEGKFENKALKSSKDHWKKIGIAASFLLVMSLGVILFNLQEEEIKLKEELNVPQENNFVIKDSLGFKKTLEQNKKEVVIVEKVDNPLKSLVNNEESIVLKEEMENLNPISYAEESNEEEFNLGETKKPIDREIYGYKTTTIVTDRGVKSVNPNSKNEEEPIVAEKKLQEPKKLSPLVVIDGNVAKNGKNTLQDEDIESLIELKEPLYIINGIHYSEQEMFGPKPTSPYAPLDKQDIISLKILLEEEAIKIYGEKGKKGVVIVTTKNGKPKK